MGSPDNDEPKYRKYLTTTSLGLNMAAGMFLFSGLGYMLDQRTGGGQKWTLTGMFLGLFYCGYEAWKVIKRIEDKGHTDKK